jgi:hypothetical protein
MLAVPVLFAIALGGDLRIVTAANASECSAGEKIDGSSAESARMKMQKAGFPAVRGLKKGCDNFWHGSMLRDGQTVHVVLSPQGQVMVEGN